MPISCESVSAPLAGVDELHRAVYVSSWHHIFYDFLSDFNMVHDKGNDHSERMVGIDRKLVSVFDLLDAVGLAKAGTWAALIEDQVGQGDGDGEMPAMVADVCRRLAEELQCSPTSSNTYGPRWRCLFLLHGAAELSNARSNVNHELTGSENRVLPHMLQQMDLASGCCPPSSPVTATVDANAVMLGFSRFLNWTGAPSSSPLLGVGAHASNDTVPSVAAGNERYLFEVSRLYAAMLLSLHYLTIRPLVKLLVAFIFQDDGCLAATIGILSSNARACGSRDGRTACLRTRGVVAGIIEFALRFAAQSGSTVAAALDALAYCAPSVNRGDGSTDNVKRNCIAVDGPAPQNAQQVLVAAAMVLSQLGDQCAQYMEATKDSNERGDVNAIASTANQEVMHAVQEVLFTIILANGTREMQRPAASNHPEHHPMICTERGLCLAEVDAFVQVFFPTLLQQIGYEWPWSETLRHCRSLDKHQKAFGEVRASVDAGVPVAWSSQYLFEQLLLELFRRTYSERLHNVLPSSFDRMMEHLAISPASHSPLAEEEEGASTNMVSTAPCFELPVYYREAGEVVVAYFRRAGLGGLQCDEAERTLTMATASLPMMVQLRALVTSTHDSANDNHDGEVMRDMRLSSAQAEWLQWRYRSEVLLAAMVVYTQLRVPSQVQQMCRILSPLFTSMALEVSRYRSSSANFIPLLKHRHSAVGASTPYSQLGKFTLNDKEVGAQSTRLTVAFTATAQLLINQVGYQFYPLEWLPEFTLAYHQAWEEQQYKSSQQDAVERCVSWSPLPYSVYAAVAHQFGLQSLPLSSSGAPQHPGGLRSQVVTPSGLPIRFLGDKDSPSSGTAICAHKMMNLFLRSFMEVCYLDGRASSCDLEAKVMTVATRRVHTSGADTASGGKHTDALSGAVASVLKPGVLQALLGIQPLYALPPKTASVAVNPSHEVGLSANSRVDASDVDAAVQALLRYGVSSFHTVVEAKDFVLTLAQSFLPLTTHCFGDRRSSFTGNSRTDELLAAAHLWCQHLIAPHSTHSAVKMLLRQAATCGGPPMTAMQCVYNSCTFDSSLLARTVLRRVEARLLEKLTLSNESIARLEVRRNVWRAGMPLDADSAHQQTVGQATLAPADTLLMHQWLQLRELKDQFGLTETSPSAFNNAAYSGEVPDLTAVQWVWGSPFFSSEWQTTEGPLHERITTLAKS